MKTHAFEAKTELFNQVFFGQRRFLIVNKNKCEKINIGDEILFREVTDKKVIARQSKHIVGVVVSNVDQLKEGFAIVSLT